jgi:hypothetical protein
MRALALLACACSAAAAGPTASPGVVGAGVALADGTTPAEVFLRAGEPIALYAYVIDEAGACTSLLAEVNGVRCASPGLAAPPTFHALLPRALDYDNPLRCASAACAAPIIYDPHPIAHAWRLDDAAGAGTHRFAVSLDGAPPPPGPGSLALVRRRGDSYPGLAAELVGVPFVHVPARLAAGHQTDLRLGADCVALVIYGQRRLGRDVPYVAPRALPRFAPPVPAGPDGRVVVQSGDVLSFGFQTAILAEDRPPLGVLDDDDRVLHTYHGLAEETTFGALPYRGNPVTVLRWPP